MVGLLLFLGGIMKQVKPKRSWIRKFNDWVDEFILELAKPLMLVMFIMGTADVLFQGWLADQWWFSIIWAVVQAITVDGLFFAVWSRVFSAKWTKENWLTITFLILIGLVLSLVVIATNAILSMQQVLGVTSAKAALIQLGIDPVVFNMARSILVVSTTIMVAFVYHKTKFDGESANHTSGSTSGNSRGNAKNTTHTSGSTSGNKRGKVVKINGSNQAVPLEIKEKVVNLIRQGVDIGKLAKDFAIPHTTLYRWKKQDTTEQEPLQTQAQTD